MKMTVLLHKGQVWQFTTEPTGSVRAFPGAEGYGAYSLGGRGGDVYHVTNLTDDAASPLPGSLRYGIDTARDRVRLFLMYQDI